jgi:hypoxanthine phosphoribosyltransferase
MTGSISGSLPGLGDPSPAPGTRAAGSRFAHASEAELARILDFYGVEWRYEPDTFPIGWSLDGEVVESFSPDFYLPELDLYVELTTLKQKLVRKKNRKLRRLRELYPDVHIKLFYARDFRMLMLKFGRMALVDELTGTMGQATPPRTDVAPAGARLAADAPDLAGQAAGFPVSSPVAPLAMAGAAGTETLPAPIEARGRRRGRRRRRSAERAAGAVPGPSGHDADAGTA